MVRTRRWYAEDEILRFAQNDKEEWAAENATTEQTGYMKIYNVYIMANQARTLYVGVTSNIERRVFEHKQKVDAESFTSRYNITGLVWYAETNQVIEAIAKEKEIKGWLRARKKALIQEHNPEWRDLSEDWYA